MNVNPMDNIPVNWNVLDAIVLDYAEVEQLLVDSDAKGPRNFEVRCTISHIRRLIEGGWVSEALDLIQQLAPSVLKDQWLLFRLHKQKFVELLRSGNADARAQAIQCSRSILGPCALDAYPEAYEEFKRLLLALIYNTDDEGSPIAEEWSEARRMELAATVTSALKAQLHAYDPTFSLALRYLISTHNSYCFRQGVASPIAHIADAVLVKEKDPPATLHDCLLEAPCFNEVDVQALAHAVDLSRQGALDSLRYTGGDLMIAFKNELSRIKMETGILDELVREYCVYRGLIDCVSSSSSCTNSQSTLIVPDLSDEIGSSARDGSQQVRKFNTPMDTSSEDAAVNTPKLANITFECRSSIAESKWESDNVKACGQEAITGEQLHTLSEHRAAGDATDAEEATMEEHLDTFSGQSAAGEDTGANISAASESLCSTSGPLLSDGSVFVKQKHKTVRQKVRSSAPRKRWKGRPALAQTGNEQLLHLEGGRFTSTFSDQSRETHDIKIFIEEEKHHEIEKYGIALEIRDLACEGMIDEVIHEVKQLNPQFFEHNPHLLFQLKQAEFLKLVETGNYAEALGVARSDMGPLAAKYRDLLKPLKETVLALARPQGEAPVKPTSPSLLATALQVALGASLGITEPSLMKIMRATLYTHTEWFKLQMCSDSFAEILKINELKEIESTGLGNSCQGTQLEANAAACSQLTAPKNGATPSDGSLSQQPDSSRHGALFDDGSILTVMEWMALPRGDAIQLLAQYDGNVENVFEHILS